MNLKQAIETLNEKSIEQKREMINLIGWEGVEMIVYNDGDVDTRQIGSYGDCENEIIARIDLSPCIFRDLYSEHGFWCIKNDKPKNDLTDEDVDCLYDWLVDEVEEQAKNRL